MSEKQVAMETVSKALEQLQDLAKGHSSRGTATTKVESMRDASVGAGSSAGATQVHHTPSNSDPKSWAGSVARDCPEDGATDAIEENGMDYKGGAQMVKSILVKLAKGLPLTAEESAVYSAIAKGDLKMMHEDEDDKKDEAKKAMDKEDDDKEMGKSLSDHAQAHEEVQKGLELSAFLKGWTDVQEKALVSTEGRILSQVQKSLQGLADTQESFNGELAKSIASLAEVLALQSQRIEQIEATPARGPKSQVAAVEKSFGAGGVAPEGGESLSKSQVLDTMVDMVQKGKISATDVVKFESTSQLTPAMEKAVHAHRSGR